MDVIFFSHYPSGHNVQHTARQIRSMMGKQLAEELGRKCCDKQNYIKLVTGQCQSSRNVWTALRHRVLFVCGPVCSQDLVLMNFVGLFQLRILYHSVIL